MRIFLGWVWIIFPGCWALMGPPEARGPLGEDLTVQCWYGKGYENYIKYWCRGTTWTSCHIVVKTGSEATVKSDRVSIRDIHTFCMFVVTMRNLTVEDSGTYWCGIERPAMDLMFSVKVNVLPAVPTSPPPAPGKEPTVNAAFNKTPFTWTVPTVAEPNSTVHRSDPSPSTRDPVLQILIPCLLLVLLLILITVIVFRRTSQRKAKALKRAPAHREKNFHPYRLAPGGTKFSATSDAEPGSKAAVCPTMEETPDPAADEAVYENAPNDTQASGSMEEVVPDTVTCPISHTQIIYTNMEPNPCSRTTPSRPSAKPGKNATG